MVDRQLLAAVLGVGLGIVFIAVPSLIFHIHTLGRGPHDRHGEFGNAEVSGKWRRIIQGVGALVVAIGLYFGYASLLA